MSKEQKKSTAAVQKAFEAIEYQLAQLKPQFDQLNSSNRCALERGLHHLATLAEAFTGLHARAKDRSQFADKLDQEGVNLWNLTGTVRKTPDDDGRVLVTALRLAAFRLIEAGLESKPDIISLIHVLQVASKTGASLCDVGKSTVANSVLTSAAKVGNLNYEELLRNAEDPENTHKEARATAVTLYYSCRMEAAWKEGNETLAEYMSRKITEDSRIALVPQHVREGFAVKLHEIGRAILKRESEDAKGNKNSRPAEALPWLQSAFGLVDKLDGVRSADLKIPILRTLARTYYLADMYDRAEATLEEVTLLIEASTEPERSGYQELRWLKLAVLKRMKAGPVRLLENHMAWSESTVTDLLQDLRSVSHQQTLAIDVTRYGLDRALAIPGTDHECVDRLLLSLLFYCSKDEDHARGIAALESAFVAVHEARFELMSTPTMACLALIWQYGDRLYNAKNWNQAADWYMLGSHEVFHNHSPTSRDKCFRKAALCYIDQREYARASAVIRRCPPDQAATQYLVLLASVQQGLEDEAIRAVNAMVQAPDFDRKMLLLATHLSHQSGLKPLLLVVLEALLKTMKARESNGEPVVEAMTLIRCIIRLILSLMADPTSKKSVLIDSLVGHFRTSKIFAEAAHEQKAVHVIMKDISWIWRTAYNSAVQGCAEWVDHGDRVSELFRLAADHISILCDASPVEPDEETYIHLINSTFCAVTGDVFTLRAAASESPVEDTRCRAVAADVASCLRKITSIATKSVISPHEAERVEFMCHTLRIFEAEMFVQVNDWVEVSRVVKDVTSAGRLAVDTYGCIADLLWSNKQCPVNVLYEALESVLRASLNHSALSVTKFSRWLRGIVTIALARNTIEHRLKAIGFVEQAIAVMNENADGDDAYPQDERQWLLATSYNAGIECFEASLLDEAKRWFESATLVCKYVPEGQTSAEKISNAYTSLLARYTPSASRI
ncbi:SPO22-domain-containing protein [Fistulina hepatica ATCC 64428]|uniref:SPO22-domain-containing protein n=1 Tax=Fistulina hepatica ATCC 64428 TaxID=1128425 RepID=A0A0D7AQ17_9AGAR|nr:SPO22-domain-containing protein [Fistulina hepatica ATCC 64428]